LELKLLELTAGVLRTALQTIQSYTYMVEIEVMKMSQKQT